MRMRSVSQGHALEMAGSGPDSLAHHDEVVKKTKANEWNCTCAKYTSELLARERLVLGMCFCSNWLGL